MRGCLVLPRPIPAKVFHIVLFCIWLPLPFIFLLVFREKKNTERAEGLLSELLRISPDHSNGNLTMAKLFIEKLRKGEIPMTQEVKTKVCSYFDRALTNSKEVSLC